MKNIVIVGVGFPDVLNIIEEINKNEKKIKLIGFVDDNKKIHGKKFWGYKVISGINWLKNKNVYVVNSVAKNCLIREKVFKELKKLKVKFTNLIDPTVSTKNVKLDNGIIINKGTSFGFGSRVGFGSILSWDSHLGHGSFLGKNCFLAKGATALGNVKIGDRVFIGSNSSILPNIKVFSDCNIFSNSVITTNLKAKSFVINKN